jgi:hypothetical protein
MTLLHFVNLSALTLVPQFLVYKLMLAEFGLDYSLVALTAGLYLITALGKLLLEDALQSSLVPHSFSAAVVHAVLALLDAVALGVAVSRRRALYAAALTAGLAWAFTDAFTRRILVFWFKAAGPEYSSEHLDSAIVSQFALLMSLCVALLAALFLRKVDQRRTIFPWIAVGVLVPTLVEWLSGTSGLLGNGVLNVPLLPLVIGATLSIIVVKGTRSLYVSTTTVGAAESSVGQKRT